MNNAVMNIYVQVFFLEDICTLDWICKLDDMYMFSFIMFCHIIF